MAHFVWQYTLHGVSADDSMVAVMKEGAIVVHLLHCVGKGDITHELYFCGIMISVNIAKTFPPQTFYIIIQTQKGMVLYILYPMYAPCHCLTDLHGLVLLRALLGDLDPVGPTALVG